MDKTMAEHARYMTTMLETTEDKPVERSQLWEYHLARLRDFQHERLIHLIVTCFVGLLTVLFGCLLLRQAVLSELTWLVAILTGILLILTVFYLWHYYKLENGTQALYKFSEAFRPKK